MAGSLSLLALVASGCATPHANHAVIQQAEPASLGINVARLDQARDTMLAEIKAGVVPGAVMVVGRHGKVAWTQTLGTQGPKDPTPMNTGTIFRIQSMTKPIVSVAVMTLVQEGKIGLDDPVSKYLPEFANSTVLDENGTIRPAKTPMTIRHLLTHTSGLIAVVGAPRTPLHKIWADSGTWTSTQTVLEASRKTGALPLLNDPGTLWNYGRSPDVLGAILEVVTGKTFDVALKELIFVPLGMKDTDFYFAPEQAKGRLAMPSTGRGSDPTQRRAMMSGSNGLFSTTDDYLRFTMMIAGGGAVGGVRILKPETLKLMVTDQLGPEVSRKSFQYKDGGGFGLGFGLKPEGKGGPHETLVYTWGGSDGTNFWVDPKSGVFTVLMIQNGRDGSRLQASFNQAVFESLTK
ncbi:MAG: serine hydrolase domain-containing protein [Steroidobacteraceae bacterium]